MDILTQNGPLFLGSRFRRLAERLQADAVALHEDAGLQVQATFTPLLIALDSAGTLTVGALAQAVGSPQPAVTRALGLMIEQGLTEADKSGGDQRVRNITLTQKGRDTVLRARLVVWPRLEAAVTDLLAHRNGGLLDQLTALDEALEARAFLDRARAVSLPELRILEWDQSRASKFKAINEEWITRMYALEKADTDVLDHPYTAIIEPGGDILFAEAPQAGIIGTCALQRTGPNAFELIKMGVYEAARGLGAGDLLLKAAISRAKELGAQKLYLLSNKKSATAIRMYEKAGFVHSDAIMKQHGAEFERCDVAMDFPL